MMLNIFYFRVALQVLAVMSFSAGYSQIATLDSKKGLATMPVFAKVDTLVQDESKKYLPEYTQKKDELLKINRRLGSHLRFSAESREIEPLRSSLSKAQLEMAIFEKNTEQKLAEYKSLILTPYYEKVNKAIQTVALLRKFKQVMDVRSVSFAYIDPSADITEDVINQLKKIESTS